MQLVDMLRDRPDIAAIFNALLVLSAAAASITDERAAPDMPPVLPSLPAIHAAVTPVADAAVPPRLVSDEGTECGPFASLGTTSPTLLLPVTTFLYFLRVQQVRSGIER